MLMSVAHFYAVKLLLIKKSGLY